VISGYLTELDGKQKFGSPAWGLLQVGYKGGISVNFKQATCAVILALGSVLGVALSGAQQTGKMTRVGFLGTGPAPTPATSYAPLQAFRRGLDELGYVEGRDVVIETRWAEGRLDQLPALAAELVGLRVDILVGVGAVVARAAESATTTIPIVMAVVIDPVNLVAERPGGNLTGLTTFDPQEARKKLALLQEVVPGLARVALLGDQALRDTMGHTEQARALGLQPQSLTIAGASPDLEAVFQAIRREHADALLVLELPATVMHRKRIAELAAQQRLPTLFAAGSPDRGVLLGYGTRVTEAARRLAAYVDRDCKGGAARRPAFRGRRAPRAHRQSQDGEANRPHHSA
jgi:putative ABC transport system substrate-binding protein